MAKCEDCGQEMSDFRTIGCKIKKIEGLNRIPYDNPYDIDRCHDCNVLKGQIHHTGCDLEICPKCGGQLIGCNCFV